VCLSAQPAGRGNLSCEKLNSPRSQNIFQPKTTHGAEHCECGVKCVVNLNICRLNLTSIKMNLVRTPERERERNWQNEENVAKKEAKRSYLRHKTADELQGKYLFCRFLD
jgi:hypothetical protein